MRTILLATGNKGKLAEISAMLDLSTQWKTLADFPGISEVEEDGRIFAENARKKALGYARQTGLWTLADDSGLVIEALDGAPGVLSARFCGLPPQSADRKTIDRKNYEKVLALLQDRPDVKRTAHFACCLCLASPERVLIETDGRVEGVIVDNPRGENGFGYDPIFLIPSLNKTVAELTDSEKNSISHRGRAMARLKPLLRDLLRCG